MDLFEYLLAMQKGGGGAKGSSAVYSGKDIVYDSVGQYAYVSTATFPKLKDNDIYFVTETYTSNGYTFKKGSIYVLTQGTGDEFDATLLNEEGITYEPYIDVVKGDIITMNVDGTDKQFRVLKIVGGTVVEVLCLFNAISSNIRFRSEIETDTYSDGSVGIKYADGVLDEYLNVTFYNTFSQAAKDALIDKNVIQDMWYTSGDGDPDYWASSQQISLKAGATLTVGNRHIYPLSVQDAIDYLEVTPEMTIQNSTWNSASIEEMFFGAQTAPSNYIWFITANASSSSAADALNIASGRVEGITASAALLTRPAFQIDLSKIPYTKV